MPDNITTTQNIMQQRNPAMERRNQQVQDAEQESKQRQQQQVAKDADTTSLVDRKGDEVKGGPATRRSGMDAEREAEEENAQSRIIQPQTGEWKVHLNRMRDLVEDVGATSQRMQSSPELAQMLQHVGMVQMSLHALEAAEGRREQERLDAESKKDKESL